MQSINGAIQFAEVFDDDFCYEIAGRRLFIVTTPHISAAINLDVLLGARNLVPEIHLVPDGEDQKRMPIYQSVLEHLAEVKFPRDGILIAIGGGSTTDLGGFVAATWMRGIEWIAIPTTLAAMVDAAIGGKNGINLDSGKNLVGTFHLPQRTIIDRRLLATLEERDLAAGMAEIIKCGMIDDPEILILAEQSSIETLGKERDQRILDQLIERSVEVKTRIVSRDLRESGERAFLNYGHTLGHAIEAVQEFKLRHGEAISMGMIFAARLSQRLLGLEPEAVKRQQALLERYRLPVSLSGMSFQSLLEIMERDKKIQAGRLRFVLLKEIGKPELIDSLNVEMLESVFSELVKGA